MDYFNLVLEFVSTAAEDGPSNSAMDKRNAEIYVLSIYTMFFFVSILIRLENGIFCRP